MPWESSTGKNKQMATSSYPSAATDFLNQTSGIDTTPYWNPTDMGSKWGIPNPAPTPPTGGNMPFPWMAAATVAAPSWAVSLAISLFNAQREGSREAIGSSDSNVC